MGGGGPPHPGYAQTAPAGAARHDSRYGRGPCDPQIRHPAVRAGYPGIGGPPPHVMGGMGMPAYGAPAGGPGARFCVIKLKGLPFGVKEYEIGLFLVGIVESLLVCLCVWKVSLFFSCRLVSTILLVHVGC